MKVIKYPKAYKFNSPTLILGGFEIFHKGHMELYKKAKEISQGDILIMVVENILFLPKNNKKIVTTINPRLQQLANMKIDAAILMEMNNKFMNQTGDIFIKTLIEKYNIKNLVCGKDFKYGRLANSSISDLKKTFPNTYICNIAKVKDVKISSSLIKELIYYGNITEANSLIINKWTTEGLIDHGWILIQQSNVIVPHSGIYSISVEYENIEYFGILHISMEKQKKIFLIELNKALLGRNVYIHWKSKIRTIVKKSEDGVSTKDVSELKILLSKEN